MTKEEKEKIKQEIRSDMRKWQFLESNVRDLLWDTEDYKVTIDEIIEGLNKRPKILYSRFKDEDKQVIKDRINRDTTYFSDLEFRGDTLQRKDYEPFTCEFTTSGKIKTTDGNEQLKPLPRNTSNQSPTSPYFLFRLVAFLQQSESLSLLHLLNGMLIFFTTSEIR